MTDSDNNSKNGGQIIFEGLNTHKIYQEINNTEDKFEIQLNGNDTNLKSNSHEKNCRNHHLDL